MTLIAQISDTHIRQPGELIEGKVDTFAYLANCIERINVLPQLPDLLIASGDLADGGSAPEYLRLKSLLDQLRMPYYVMPGNHDNRDNMREVFGHTPALPPSPANTTQYAIELPALRILCLDTLDDGEESGWLCTDRLNWLREQLAASGKPVMLFLHHPPFACGIAGMDDIKLRNPEDLARALAGHPRILGLACGHVHRSVFTRWAGLPACICPSPAHQIHLDTRPNEPLAWTLEPGGFLLHIVESETLTTHVVTGSTPKATAYS